MGSPDWGREALTTGVELTGDMKREEALDWGERNTYLTTLKPSIYYLPASLRPSRHMYFYQNCYFVSD